MNLSDLIQKSRKDILRRLDVIAEAASVFQLELGMPCNSVTWYDSQTLQTLTLTYPGTSINITEWRTGCASFNVSGYFGGEFYYSHPIPLQKAVILAREAIALVQQNGGDCRKKSDAPPAWQAHMGKIR